MIELFSLPVFRRALWALAVTGLSFPALGTCILALELVPARFAVMHASLLGAAAGILLGLDPGRCALAAAVLGGLFVARMSEKSRASAGGALGLVMTLCLGLSFILFYKAGTNGIEAFNLFWGSILALDRSQLWLTVAGAVTVILLALVFFREIEAVLYDREFAASLGVPVRAIHYGIIVLVCAGIGLSMRITGALMSDALTILPALAARFMGRSLRATLAWGAFFGLASNVLGFGLALVLDLPVSPAIIVAGCLMVGISALAARGRRRSSGPRPCPL